MGKLSGKKVAILTENGFEEVELTSPMKALKEAGATVRLFPRRKTKSAPGIMITGRSTLKLMFHSWKQMWMIMMRW